MERECLSQKKLSANPGHNICFINRMGWYHCGTNTQGPRHWDKHTGNLSSNVRELLAILLSLKSLLHLLRNKDVQILTDNVTACAYVNLQGGPVHTLDIIAKNIWDLAIRNCIQIQAKHIAGGSNQVVDGLSRLPASYEWYLHPGVFQFIDKIHGPHTVDRFASVLTRQLKRYNSLYWDPESEGVDALHQNNWDLGNNFVNCQMS